MPKLLRQNVGGIDYNVAGCALTATCATAAATAAKTAILTDGDTLADGMSVAVQFTEGNTAASPLTLTVGGVTANICDPRGQNIGGNIWQSGNVCTFLYTHGKFLLLNADLNSVSITYNYSSEPRDILSLISNSANRRVSFMEIGGNNLTNDPAYTGSGDYYFYVFKTDGYISVTAFDLFTNQVYKNSCQNGVWRAWEVITRNINRGVTPTITPADLSQAIADMLNILSVDALPIGSFIYCCNYGTYFEANFTVAVHGAILVRGSTMGWDGTGVRSDHLFTASKYAGEDWVRKIY